MTVATADQLTVAVLGSGSRGNCTWIGTATQGVLIDCGLSARQIQARLDALGLSGAPIDAVLITHEHTDHVAAAAVLERALARTGPAPAFLMTPGTARALPDRVRPTHIVEVPAGRPIPWRGWTLEPWRIPHDTADPVAWAVDAQGARAAVVTDLGHAPRSVRHLLAGVDLAVFEFNHDETMLMDGAYPWALKQRVRSRHGHLSNDAAADALADAATAGRLRDVILGHLSRDNNTPDKALEAASRAVHGTRTRLHVALQDTPAAPRTVSPPTPPQPALF